MLRSLSRQVTFVIVPPPHLPVWRLRFTLPFILFGLGLWSGLTLWAGFSAGRHVDYWLTKADNRVMRARLASLAGAVARSREDLSQAREADRKLRALLGMPGREALPAPPGMGGPGPRNDRDSIRQLGAMRLESINRLESFQEIEAFIDKKRSLMRATPLGWPARGRVSSRYGYRFSPFRRRDATDFDDFHPGLDIANGSGTPITATADGVVARAGWHGGYGRMVFLKHGWGYSTLYGHTSRLSVRRGQAVRRGQVIAAMGTTGQSTGSHLHYEIWRNGKPVDPRPFLDRSAADWLSQTLDFSKARPWPGF